MIFIPLREFVWKNNRPCTVVLTTKHRVFFFTPPQLDPRYLLRQCTTTSSCSHREGPVRVVIVITIVPTHTHTHARIYMYNIYYILYTYIYAHTSTYTRTSAIRSTLTRLYYYYYRCTTASKKHIFYHEMPFSFTIA